MEVETGIVVPTTVPQGGPWDRRGEKICSGLHEFHGKFDWKTPGKNEGFHGKKHFKSFLIDEFSGATV